MKHPRLLLGLLPLGLWAAFALPDLLAADGGPWSWRRHLILLSGIVALWWMSAGMLLATRAPWLENIGGGLDRLYRLHKQVGIGAGLLVLLHWQLEWLPKTLAKAGLIAGPNRPRGAHQPDFWIDLAKDVGEWAGYLLMALVVVALLRRIPYRAFRLVHKAFGAIFLAGAFHGLLLMPAEFWQTPLAWTTLAVAALGVVPALLSLSGRIGRRRQHAASLTGLRAQPGGILELDCRPASWPGHRAGQFLFVDFGVAGEGAHPFTIASDWQAGDGTLTLAIKALGKFTASLPERLQVGQALRLEGPYGHFDFSPKTPVDRAPAPQIWVAGGIGITPFLARLQALAGRGERADVDLFYSSTGDGSFPETLAALCARTGVRLHRRLSERDGPFTDDEIAARQRRGCSVWFCGPRGWGEALARRFRRNGLAAADFHQEAFEFR